LPRQTPLPAELLGGAIAGFAPHLEQRSVPQRVLVLPSGFPKQLDEWCLPTLSEERTQKDWGNWLFWFMAHRLHGLNRNSYEIIFIFLAKKTN
jgi:hypothetical protein